MTFKTTAYFQFMRMRSDRAPIKDEWIEYVMKNPVHEEIQLDGCIRRWARIEEVGRYLRVVLLPDGETVHNTFFDRRFRLGE